ncbi:MAG TPA: class I SAM-dependent methyltransferase [Microvirga sp.]|jgi:SAM-dependent methyltransferase
MMSAFEDHFSTGSADYAAYRPTYPAALVDALADLAPATDAALDVGCGTGQLAVLLAARFRSVIATDASAQQIAQAVPQERVNYRVAPADASGLAGASVDLLTAAQAAHWFDLDAFYAEARRVLRPRGILALITYGIMRADAALDPVIARFYWDVIGPYWPPERRHVEQGYRAFPFPFEEIALPPLAIEVRWTRDDLFGYVDTWSAVKAVEKALGREPVEALRRDVAAVWTDPEERRTIRFPLSGRVGRVT